MANKKVRGLTIEFGGDTSKLIKSFKNMDAPIKKTERELKEVNELLKYDFNKTDLVTQQQGLLSDAIADTSKKLEVLRQNQEKVNKAHEANADWERQYEPLKKQLDESADKMKRLQNQEEKMKAQLNSGEISQEQYDKYQKKLEEVMKTNDEAKDSIKKLEKAFADTGHIDDKGFRAYQREVAKTEKELKDLRGQLYETQSKLLSFAKAAEKTGKSWQSAGEKISGVGNTLTKGATAPIVALGTASVAAYENINGAVSKFQTKLGTTAEQTKEYKAILEELGSTGVGNFGELADAIISVEQNMKTVPKDQLSEVTEQAVQLSAVMEKDVSETTRAAGTLMKQFGLDGKTSLDMIAKGYQSGLDFSGEFLDVLNEYSVHFKSLGFSAEDMFNILIKGSQEGAWNLDKVGDAIKEGNIRLKDLSDSSRGAFESLGLNADQLFSDFAAGGEKAKLAFMTITGALSKVEDETKRNQIGVALFGTQYEDLEKTVVQSFSSITDELGDYNGAAQKVAEDNRTLKQDIQGLWNDLQKDLAPLGKSIVRALKSAQPSIKDITKAVTKLFDAFSKLSPKQQDFIVKTAAITAVAGPAAKAFGGFVTTTGKTIDTFGKLSKSFGDLKKKLAENKTGMIGGADAMKRFAAAADVAEGKTNILGTVLSGLKTPAGIAGIAIAGVGTAFKLMADSAEREHQRIADAFVGCIPDMEAWQQEVDSATSCLSGFSIETAVTGESISAIEEKITTARENIHGIAETAASESRQLTDAERQEVENLIGLIDTYTQKKLEAYLKQQEYVTAMIAAEQEMTTEAAQNYLLSQQEANEQALAQAKLHYESKIQEAEDLYGHLGELDKEAYEKAKEAAQTKYNEEKQMISDNSAESLSLIQQRYFNEQVLKDENLVKFFEYAQQMTQLEQDYVNKVNELEEKSKNEHINVSRQISYAGDLFLQDRKDLRDKMVDVLGDEQQETIAAWMAMAETTEQYGGEITNEQWDIVNSIIGCYDDLPDKFKKVGDVSMETLRSSMEKKKPGILGVAESIANLIPNTIKKILKIASPSKVMKNIAKNTWDGLLVQTKKEIPKIEQQVEDVADLFTRDYDMAMKQMVYDPAPFMRMDLIEGAKRAQEKNTNPVQNINIEIKVEHMDASDPADIRQLAEQVSRQLQSDIERRGAAYGWR